MSVFIAKYALYKGFSVAKMFSHNHIKLSFLSHVKKKGIKNNLNVPEPPPSPAQKGN